MEKSDHPKIGNKLKEFPSVTAGYFGVFAFTLF
jgi:hypothetical protein